MRIDDFSQRSFRDRTEADVDSAPWWRRITGSALLRGLLVVSLALLARGDDEGDALSAGKQSRLGGMPECSDFPTENCATDPDCPSSPGQHDCVNLGTTGTPGADNCDCGAGFVMAPPGPGNQNLCDGDGCVTEAIVDRQCHRCQRAPYSYGLTFDKFDPSLGELIKVEVFAAVSVDADVCFENNSPTTTCESAILQFAAAGTACVIGAPPGSVLDCILELEVLESISAVGSLPPMSTQTQCYENMFTACDQTPNPCDGTGVIPITDAGLLAFFTQNGGDVDFVVDLNAIDIPPTPVFGSGCQSASIGFQIVQGWEIEVKYIYCPNLAPICMDDEAATCKGDPVDVFLLANDMDPDGMLDCSSIDIVSGPSNGTYMFVNCPAAGCVTTAPNGCRLRYTPNPNFTGCDTIVYRVADDEGCYSEECEIVICVYPDPVANDDMGDVCQGNTVCIDVLDNDSDGGTPGACCDPQSIEPGSLEITDPPDHGTASIVGGEICYTPDPDFCGGQDEFRYRFRTNQPSSVPPSQRCASNEATVTVNVFCGPVAVDDCLVIEEGETGPFDIYFLENDIPPTGGLIDCSNIVVSNVPTGATVQIVGCAGAGCDPAVCHFEYTPSPDFAQQECFDYSIRTANAPPGEQCESMATVCVKVNCPTYDRRKPSALLVYPEFDNRDGAVTIITVTNTHNTHTVGAHFEYVDKDDCSAFDREKCLTPRDTFSLITEYHNPEENQGYLYVYATCWDNGAPIAFNYLIGSQLVVDGILTISYSVNPWAFCAPGEEGEIDPDCPPYRRTDCDNDGIRDLDNKEYECAPDQILIPRFHGQNGPDSIQSCLVLINLSGGKAFTTTLDFTLYNDNEEPFSANKTFYCWWKGPLEDISIAARNSYLRTASNHDPDEILGNELQESGWIRIDGDIAQSSTTVIDDPAFLAVLVECVDVNRCVADLPFELCSQNNGDLLPVGNEGDPVPDTP